MNKKYFRVFTNFRRESYAFLVCCNDESEIDGKMVCNTICCKFQMILPGAEISYSKKEIQDFEYLVSYQDKYDLTKLTESIPSN